MPNTLGYHLVKSCYGLWLPGDDRGSWSEAWDEQVGYIEPHILHPGDPVRLRMAQERMTDPPVRLTTAMIAIVAETLADLIARSGGGLSITAAALEPTHVHLRIPYSGRDIERTAAWIADQTTKAIHLRTGHAGPVWCKGRWRGFIYDTPTWDRVGDYIERHNERRGLPRRPWPFLV